MRVCQFFRAPGLALLIAAAILAAPLATQAQTAEPDLVGRLAASGQSSQFLQALQTAGLTETLQGTGPFTVWAPTDAAFNRLPPSVRQQLQDPTTLRRVLSYHVASGVVTAAQIVQVPNVRTLEGEAVKVTAANGGVQINDAPVVSADLLASNGIIHVIDGVLIPPSQISALPNTGVAAAFDYGLVIGLGLVIIATGLGLLAIGHYRSSNAPTLSPVRVAITEHRRRRKGSA
jgi:uncharacterized surface protein with fasciclin (FAS1) repeats